MKRRILGVLLLLAAIGAAAAWYLRPPQAPADRLVLQGDIDVRQVNLAFKVDGRIASLAVDEGDAVKAGQLLATLDRRYFKDELRVSQAQRDAQAALLAKLEHGSRPEEVAQGHANVALAQANVDNTSVTLSRQEKLVATDVASHQALDNALAAKRTADAQLAVANQALRLLELGPRVEDIDAARAQLAQMEAALSQAQRRLEDAELHAPSDGVILTRAREVGAIVAAGDPVFTLTVGGAVWVRAYVDEPDLGKVVPGMAAEIATDAGGGRVYHGRIGFVSPLAEFTPKSVETRALRTALVYRMRIVVEDADDGLRQGMPVTVTLRMVKGS